MPQDFQNNPLTHTMEKKSTKHQIIKKNDKILSLLCLRSLGQFPGQFMQFFLEFSN